MYSRSNWSWIQSSISLRDLLIFVCTRICRNRTNQEPSRLGCDTENDAAGRHTAAGGHENILNVGDLIHGRAA